MKKQSNRFDRRAPSHHWAVLHAVGELEDIHQRGATIAEIARFMNVSKPTAKKQLDDWKRRGVLITTKENFSRFGRNQYELCKVMRSNYELGVWKSQYADYCQKVLKVIILPDSEFTFDDETAEAQERAQHTSAISDKFYSMLNEI